MSKLSKYISTNRTEREIILPPLMTIEESYRNDVPIHLEKAILYRIGVKIGAECAARNSHELEYLKRQVHRQICEEAYGEFRPFFRNIQQALWTRDFDKAAKLLDEFYTEMYQ